MDANNALHAFAHADGGYHLMGCMLSAASCNKWLMEDIFRTEDYAAEQAGITEEMLGRNHVYFLPYLMGERSPINDTNARGTFIGMTMDTRREDLTQAVLEGVAFAIRDSFEVAKKLGISISRSKICGGRSQKSPVEEDFGQRAAGGAGQRGIGARAWPGRRHACHGGLRRLCQCDRGLPKAGPGVGDCPPGPGAGGPV